MSPPFDLTWPQLVGLHAAVTWFLAGLIWVVQLVHYPLFAAVEPALFSLFAEEHARRITWIVAPAMLLEGLLGAALLLWLPAGGPAAAVCLGLLLLLVVWGSTAFVQVPCHRRLARGFDLAIHARLVRGNWLRTAAWSARAMLALALLGGLGLG